MLTTHMPAHNHVLNVQSGPGTTGVPSSSVVLAQTVVDDGTPARSYASTGASTPPDTTLTGGLGSTGSDTPLPMRNPYVGLQYVICVSGIFPSRN
jgi:microcystin-dependent protein